MGQLFFSLSVAMGIMVAYGSYVKDDANLVKSINQIEIFDTAVAFLAGVMIIPAVYKTKKQLSHRVQKYCKEFLYCHLAQIRNYINQKSL